MNCGICSFPLGSAGIVLEADGSAYRRCGGCGSIVLAPLPTVEANAHFEGEQAVLHQERSDEARAAYFARRLGLLEQAGGPKGRLLDIGCSTGKLMEIARARGWDVQGIELSAALAGAARRRNPGAFVSQGDFLELGELEPATFSAIVALDVIEHVLDPRAFARRARRLLAPGGTLLLQTPNARSLRARLHGAAWNMLIPAYHFHLFAPRALATLLESEGFRVRRLTTASGSGSESGASGRLAAAKQAVLAPARLGNALVVVARAAA
ncbi:MAG: hypothetical protein PWP23_1717 [Candidatus Sumerlaeota bacterium]|nr:hypothetical protein [Candidatus Sumerlaeota bacterium]